MSKRNIVVGAVCLAVVGFIVYKANQVGPAFPVPETTIGPVGAAPVDAPTLGDAGPVIEITTPIVITGKVEPFRHGTKLCQWYEDAGLRAVSQMDGTAETTCSGNTCFLLVHDSGMLAGPVMLAWLSEARSKGHNPRKENVELSVFTFENEEETDHVIYFPKLDVFERR